MSVEQTLGKREADDTETVGQATLREVPRMPALNNVLLNNYFDGEHL